MQVRELVNLGRFLNEFIKEKKLPQKYQSLINAVNQAAQDKDPEQVEPLLQSLLDLHTEVEERVLSPAQQKLLVDFGAGELMGESASDRIRGIFERNRAHPQGLVAGLQEMLTETNQLVKRSNQLVTFLDPMLTELDVGELGEDEGRLWLYFSHAASVETIEDLEGAAQRWKTILHHFSRMPGGNASAGRILQIHKYSPLEIEVAASLAVLTPLALGVQWVLGRIEQVIRILQKAEELKQLKVKTEVVEMLKEEAEEKRKAIASEAADQLQERFNGNNEARNASEQALRQIITFIEGGGQLDIDVGETGGEEEEGEEEPNRTELKRLVQTIRKEIKMLPPVAEEALEEGEE